MCKYCEPDGLYGFLNGRYSLASRNLADVGDADDKDFFCAVIRKSKDVMQRPVISIDVCVDGTETDEYAIRIRFCPRCGRDLYAEYPRDVELPKALSV